MFVWTDQELNPEQSDAVTFPGSTLLIACPGSGKTRTLTYKLAKELSDLGTSKKYVVAITYTHRAANEIRERIELLGVNTQKLWIGTIHSFCLEWVIKPYSIYVPELAHGYRIIDLHEREKHLERLCQSHRDSRVTFWDCEFYFSGENYILRCNDAGKHSVIHLILAEYFQFMRESRQIDFEMILYHAYKILANSTPIRNLLSKLFSTILVDEYQDTKDIQYRIITLILHAGAEETKLFMVGDPNQAIYSSMGGFPIDIDQLRVLSGITIEARELSQNYRSSQKIINYFGNFNVYNTNIKAAGESSCYDSQISYNTTIHKDDLIDEIARLVVHSVEVLGIQEKEICIVAPQWFVVAATMRRMVLRLPEYNFNGPGMAPLARDIENYWYKLSRIALTEPSAQMYTHRLRWAREVLAELLDLGVAPHDLQPRALLKKCNVISNSIDETEGLVFLQVFFELLFLELNVSFHNIEYLEEQWCSFFASSTARIARLETEGLVEIGSLYYFKKIFEAKSGITVSTIHSVKGAEFDVVIAHALLEGMVPHFSDRQKDESAKKLLYVVGSRARKNLHLFSETGRSRGRFGVYEPTDMLVACQFEYN